MLGAKLGMTSKQYNIVTDGLIMHYEPSFNKSWPGGSSLYNLASGSLTPTGSIITDATMVGSSGNNGGYMYFDGSDGYVNILDTPFTSVSECSIVYWTKVFSNNGSYNGFISGRDGSGLDYTTGINVDMMNASSTSFKQLNIEGAGRIGFEADDMTSDQPFDTWVHVGITVNNTLISVYINNVAEGTRARSDVAMNWENMTMGVRWYGSLQAATHIDANVGQYLIYDRVLTSDEISQNYNASKDRYSN